MLIILIYFLIFILKIEWNKYAAEGQQQGLKMFDCFVCIWWSCEYQLIAYKYLILIIFCFTESWTFSLYIYNQFTQLYTNNQKVMNKQLVLTLLLCAAVLSQSNNCPSFYGGDLLQSARNTIMRGPVDGSPERQYQTFFNFKAPANRNIQIAITTSTIGDYNPLPSYGYNYIVTAARKENSNAIIYKLFMENNNAWSTIQVSLLISGRQDLAIGNFQVPIQQWSLGSANVYSISYAVNKYLPGGPFKVAAFISGFSTTDSQFALTIVKKSFDEKAKTVDVGFFCSANPAVLTLSIAYVVYPEVHPVFQITYDLTPRAQTGSYQLAGPVNFQPNKRIQYNEWRVENRNLVCTGNQCQGNNCILRQNCAQLNGNVYQGQCVFCSPGVIFEFGRCSRKCGPNQLYVRQACACTTGYQRKGISCVKKASCGNNEVYSNDQKKCICKAQAYRVGTECINCPNGAIGTPDGLSCFCNAPGKIFKQALNICVDRCLQFQLWGDNKCQCINSYSWWNQGCRKCPDDAVPTAEQTSCICRNLNSFYDAERNLCVACGPYSTLNGLKNGCICDFGYQLVNGVCNQIRPKCPPGQIQQNSQCICEKGFADYGSCKKCPANTFTNTQRTRCICADPNSIFRADSFQCVSCPANSRPNDILTLCVCNPGFTQEGQNCILKCDLNEIPTEFGTCACIGGYYKPAGGVCQPRCPANQDWNGQRCICKPGYVQRNGGCTLCPVNAIPNQFRSSCRCQIPGYIFDKNTFQCVKCPEYSYTSDDDTKCLCNAGYSYIDNVCSPICGLNEALNTKTNKCECKYGFLNLGGQCVERCGLNQEWNGFECLCKSNTIKATGACRPCGENLYTNPKRTTCLCSNPKFLFNLDKFVCDPLPDYSSPNEDYTDFICYAGYRRDGYSCANPCPSGAFPDASGACVCTGGLFLINNQCQKPATCPPGSSWNSAKLQCQCNVKGQFLIDGQCTQCGQNSIYIASSRQCVCTTGFFSIGGQCVICDPKSRYNGTDCVCNLGYYGTRDQCNKCHQSCSICSGPEANQCQACSDVSLVLQKGFCSKNSPCDPGLFLYEDTCTKCSDNCIICESNFDCKTCAVGYKIEKLQLEDQKVQICVEVCGDGIKYQDECDDGNYNDDDGCSNTCRVQSGWTCEGGSSAKKSRCNKYIPDQTILIEKGSVNLGDKVVQSVRASYLPICLTKNECAQCFKAIKVNVVDANVPILVKVSYVPFSQYQYLIEYNFQGLIVTSKFKAVIKLNELYKGCLADDDYNQQLEVEIDPAFLAKVDVTQQLQFGDISVSKSKQPVIQVPSAAKKLLGLSN